MLKIMLNWLRKPILEFLSKNEKTIVVEKQTIVNHHHHYDKVVESRQAGPPIQGENVLSRLLKE